MTKNPIAITKNIWRECGPKKWVPTAKTLEIITKEPKETKLNCGNFTINLNGLVILYWLNAQKLLMIKFQWHLL